MYYPQRRLPLWSILGTREPEGETAIKTKMCSPKDVFDALSAEIRHLVSQIPLRRGRTSYKSESTSKDGSTNPITTANTIQNKHNPIIMSSPLHSHTTCDKIHQRVQTLCCYNDGGVTPPLPSNNVPHPDPLRNSAIYYPLLPSVATTQLNYLRKSLSIPVSLDHFHFTRSFYRPTMPYDSTPTLSVGNEFSALTSSMPV